MEISLNSVKNFNIPLYNNLASLPAESIYSDRHSPSLPHPADIFIECIGRLTISLDNMLKYIIEQRNYNDLRGDLQAYVQDLDTFYDNLYNIIITMKKPNGKIVESLRWLKENNHGERNQLSQSTLKHHKMISNINNKLKHTTMLVRPASLTYESDNTTVNGFFIGRSAADGSVSPDREIHSPYCEMNTGHSFNFFINKTISLVFFYTYHLNKILFKSKKANVDIDKLTQLYKLANVAANITQDFFPDEYAKPVGKYNAKNNKILIKYPVLYKTPADRRPPWAVNQLFVFNQRTKTGSGKMIYYKYV